VALDLDDVRRVASLARLPLDESEEARMVFELGRILDWVAGLVDVDVSAVGGTAHAGPERCPLREDTLAESLPPGDALREAAETRNGFFAVPRVLG
jgi:aspartyl-tRNA(Asn)/glutamyl-tRNA(Gln) amidotransferase subunit C